MMAVELPEPDYYTLAEVAERWGISEDVLLRLGAEGTIKYCYYSDSPIRAQLQFFPSPDHPFRFPLFHILQEEAEAFGWTSTTALIKGLFNLSSYKLKRITYYNETHELGGIRFYGKIDAFIQPDGPRVDSLPLGTHLVAGQHLIHKSDLVIPTAEIHRIEHQQEKADQAIAKAEAESPIPSQSRRALNTRAKVIGALVQSHNIQLNDRGATSALITKLELQGVALNRDTVKTILDEARGQMEKPN
ncbi:hypothetical protein [Acidithiobacillus ferriphilus]|uniref:hypothetical protein n=1 Tax=Acidithiobacillus ferriphilus TaxID=1689834 RepID=UPI001C065424|nr:hypothetical protein [Acidithiobacillus ferriphilus]